MSLTPVAKAQALNLDTQIYGTFAEIGAGQEVARHFFVAGKASQTIAKTISAYDMIYSDEIYGKEKNGRYVCESRLNKMLDKEYSLLQRRLQEHRGDRSTFFAFANTVATGTAETPRCHGWMGVRFQTKPNGPSHDVILHVRMMDRHRLQQQESLGALGVNLVHSCFFHREKPEAFVSHLVDNLKEGQIVIDYFRASGPDLAHFDNRRINLDLVKRGLSEAVLFDEGQNILNIADSTYQKSLLIQRGNYRPITVSHFDMMEKGVEQLKADMKALKLKTQDMLVLNEIEISSSDSNIDDILLRVESLARLGLKTLVTQFPLYYELKGFFRKFTQNPMILVMSAAHLPKIFDPKHYKNLQGGIFEGLGKLLDENTRLYIYPHKTDKACETAADFKPNAEAKKLFEYFYEKGLIVDIGGCDITANFHHSDQVRAMISKKDKKWENFVPGKTVAFIKEKKWL
jgi:hypothetical protein